MDQGKLKVDYLSEINTSHVESQQRSPPLPPNPQFPTLAPPATSSYLTDNMSNHMCPVHYGL